MNEIASKKHAGLLPHVRKERLEHATAGGALVVVTAKVSVVVPAAPVVDLGATELDARGSDVAEAEAGTVTEAVVPTGGHLPALA
jgi:hypothetical protein